MCFRGWGDHCKQIQTQSTLCLYLRSGRRGGINTGPEAHQKLGQETLCLHIMVVEAMNMDEKAEKSMKSKGT